MKTSVFRYLSKGLVLSLAASAGISAKAELMYAVSTLNELIVYDSLSPSTPYQIFPNFTVGGVPTSEQIVGIDYRGNVLYALGASSRLYTVNTNSADLTQVGTGQFSPFLNGSRFGFDDVPGGLAIVSEQDMNYLVDAANASVSVRPVLHYSGPASPTITGLAYDHRSGNVYGIDSLSNTLVRVDLNTGLLTTVGPLGVDVAGISGFDIGMNSGIAYLAATVSSSFGTAQQYIVDLATGAVISGDPMNNTGEDLLIRGLTAIPEPNTSALLALGGLGLLAVFLRRRR